MPATQRGGDGSPAYEEDRHRGEAVAEDLQFVSSQALAGTARVGMDQDEALRGFARQALSQREDHILRSDFNAEGARHGQVAVHGVGSGIHRHDVVIETAGSLTRI